MAGNRVDELEEKVQELEATVSGLTDELVETKERLRILEDELEPDMDPGIIEGGPTTPDVDVGDGDAGSAAQPDGGATADPTEPDGADAGDGEAPADEPTSEEVEGEDGVDGSGDDIIVA